MVFEAPGRPLRLEELPVPQPGPGQVLLRVRACGVCRTDLHLLDGEVEVRTRRASSATRSSARVAGRPARGRAVARLDVRRVRVVPHRAREPLPARALHGPRPRRRLRRVRRRRRALLLRDPGRRSRRRRPRRCCAPGSSASARCASAATRGGSGSTGSARRRTSWSRSRLAGPRGLRVHARPATRRRRRSPASSARCGPARRTRRRQRRSTRRSSSPPSARWCRSALRAVAPGGTRGLRRHPHERHPVVPLQRPVGGAGPALRREPHAADGEEFLALAPQVPVRTRVRPIRSSARTTRSPTCAPGASRARRSSCPPGRRPRHGGTKDTWVLP